MGQVHDLVTAVRPRTRPNAARKPKAPASAPVTLRHRLREQARLWLRDHRAYYALVLLPLLAVVLFLVVPRPPQAPPIGVPLSPGTTSRRAAALPRADATMPQDTAPALGGIIAGGSALVEGGRDLMRQGAGLAQRSADVVVPPWGDERVTFLVLGVDQRQQEPPRTDAMLVVSVDPGKQAAALVSIPRDLYVEVPGQGYQRINQAYVYGGPKLAVQAVQAALGVPINYYVTIDFRGFQRIIDTLGGVELALDQPLYDPYYPNDTDTGYDPLWIPAGVQRLDGAHALGYARSRLSDPESDFGRSRRQQQLMLALKAQLLRPASLARIPSLAIQLSDAVGTDFPLQYVPSLARLGVTIPADRISMGTINYEQGMVQSAITDTGADVLVPNLPRIQAVVRGVFNRHSDTPLPLSQGATEVASQP